MAYQVIPGNDQNTFPTNQVLAVTARISREDKFTDLYGSEASEKLVFYLNLFTRTPHQMLGENFAI